MIRSKLKDNCIKDLSALFNTEPDFRNRRISAISPAFADDSHITFDTKHQLAYFSPSFKRTELSKSKSKSSINNKNNR